MTAKKSLLFITVVTAFFACTIAGTINQNVFATNPLQAKDKRTIVIPAKAYTPEPTSESSKLGKALFVKYNCTSCHSVDGHGGCLGPPLVGEGARRSKDFILARITQGAKAEAKFRQIYRASELMPHPRISKQSAQAITSYLLTLEEPRSGFIISKHPTVIPQAQTSALLEKRNTSKTFVAEGKKLFFEKGCAACHTAGGVGGQFAPNLDSLKTRRDRAQIERVIDNTQLLTIESADEYSERGTMMPPLNLTAAEASKITDFLMALPSR